MADRHPALEDLRQGSARARPPRSAACGGRRQRREQPVHPAIGGDAATRRAIFDEQLRIEMRTGRIGRAGGVDKGQLLRPATAAATGKRGMQAEMLVECESAIRRPGPADRDCRPAPRNRPPRHTGRRRSGHRRRRAAASPRAASVRRRLMRPSGAAQRHQAKHRPKARGNRVGRGICYATYRRMKSGLPSINARLRIRRPPATAARVLAVTRIERGLHAAPSTAALCRAARRSAASRCHPGSPVQRLRPPAPWRN